MTPRFTHRSSGRAAVLLAATAGAAVVVGLALGGVRLSSASGDAVKLDFIAAKASTYVHTVAPAVEVAPEALQYDDRAIGTHVVEELEAENFACADTVVFFTQIAVDEDVEGTLVVDLDYQFGAVNVGQEGVGYSALLAAGLSNEGVFAPTQAVESGHSKSGDETASVVSGPVFMPGGDATWDPSVHETMDVTLRVGGLQAGEVVIARVDVRVSCFATPVTGNLHARIDSAYQVIDGQRDGRINVGQQEITMKLRGGLQTVTPTATPTETSTPTPTATGTVSPTATASPQTATPTATRPRPKTATPTPPVVTPTATSAPATSTPGGAPAGEIVTPVPGGGVAPAEFPPTGGGDAGIVPAWPGLAGAAAGALGLSLLAVARRVRSASR